MPVGACPCAEHAVSVPNILLQRPMTDDASYSLNTMVLLRMFHAGHRRHKGQPRGLLHLLPCNVHAAAVQASLQHGASGPAQEDGENRVTWLASVPAAVLVALPALAEEGIIGAPEEPADLMQTLVGVLFVLATLALTVTTLGVGYLSFTNWQNTTDDKKERAAFDRPPPCAARLSLLQRRDLIRRHVRLPS